MPVVERVEVGVGDIGLVLVDTAGQIVRLAALPPIQQLVLIPHRRCPSCQRHLLEVSAFNRWPCGDPRVGVVLVGLGHWPSLKADALRVG